MNTLAEQGTNQPLAIVGIGCHFPGGAHTPDLYWDLLRSETDATCDSSRNTLERRTNITTRTRTRSARWSTRRGGFLSEIDQFDPQFFGISPREANLVDPQQRLLLRTTWEALEDGGISADSLAGTDVGVFVGGFTLDYQLLQNQGRTSRYRFKTHSATGMMMTMLANRISFAFDFRGPSMTDRHRMLELARRGTPCGAEYLERRMRSGARRWRQHHDRTQHGDRGIEERIPRPGRAVQGLRPVRRRVRARRRWRRGRDQAPRPGTARWRRNLCADPRHSGVPGRPHRRHHRSQRGRARSRHHDGLATSRRAPQRSRICGGTRHRNSGRRPGRGPGSRQRTRGGTPGNQSAADRVGENQHRPPRGRRRRSRTDQSGVGAQTRLHPGEPASQQPQRPDPVERLEYRHSTSRSPVSRQQATRGRGQLVRLRRHQRPRRARRTPGPARRQRLEPCSATAAGRLTDLGAHRGSPRRHSRVSWPST